MRLINFFATTLATALVLSSPSIAQQGPDGAVLHPDFGELSARWTRALEGLLVPGMAVVVVEGDEILHLETFGVRDVADGKLVTPDSLFYIASATKPFVALAAMQLADEGRIDLDASVKSYLPRFELADAEAAHSMTVRDLLCHRPGLNSGPIVFLDAYSGQISEDRFYSFLSDVAPTGVVTYSNLHFTLAGRVVEAAGGMPWKEVLRARIFEPAGMRRTTGYADAMYASADVAFPSTWENGGFRYASVRKTDATMHAAGGLGTSTRDVANWLRIYLNDGMVGNERLLSSAGLGEMLATQSESNAMASRGIEGFGLGWMLGNVHGFRKYQHGGGYIGTAAMISFVPEIGVGVAVLANTGGAGSELCELVTADVYDFLMAEITYDRLPDLLTQVDRAILRSASRAPTGENPALAIDGLSAALANYVGEYTNAQWGTVRCEAVDGVLRARIGNINLSLHSRGSDKFIAYNANSVEGNGHFTVKNGVVSEVTLELMDSGVSFER